VRLIYENNSKSRVAYEEGMVKSLRTAICPMTMLNTIGYIYDNEKTAEVTSFLAENPRASALQYTNDTLPNTPPVDGLTLMLERLLLAAGMKACLVGAGGGSFLAASSVLGAIIFDDGFQAMRRAACIAWVGGTITTGTWYFLKSAYIIHSTLNRDLRTYERATIEMARILAVLISIPVGVLITGLDPHNSIGSVMYKQLLGAFLLLVGLTFVHCAAVPPTNNVVAGPLPNDIVALPPTNNLVAVPPTNNLVAVPPTNNLVGVPLTNNLPEFVRREPRPLIPFLPNYVEPAALVNAMETTASSANRLELVSLNQGMYQAHRSVELSIEAASYTP
jgi:hypothetical protein